MQGLLSGFGTAMLAICIFLGGSGFILGLLVGKFLL